MALSCTKHIKIPHFAHNNADILQELGCTPAPIHSFFLASGNEMLIGLFSMQIFWISFQSTWCSYWVINERPVSLLLRLILYVHSHYQCNILLISVALSDNWLLLDHFNGRLFSKSNVMGLIRIIRKKNPIFLRFLCSSIYFHKKFKFFNYVFQMAAACLESSICSGVLCIFCNIFFNCIFLFQDLPSHALHFYHWGSFTSDGEELFLITNSFVHSNKL